MTRCSTLAEARNAINSWKEDYNHCFDIKLLRACV